MDAEEEEEDERVQRLKDFCLIKPGLPGLPDRGRNETSWKSS